MKLPIDTNGLTCLASGSPRPVLDYETKAPKVEDGQPLHSVPITAISDGEPVILNVKVLGVPKAMEPGTQVKLTGLVASPWTNGDRSGVAFRATRVEVASPSRA